MERDSKSGFGRDCEKGVMVLTSAFFLNNRYKINGLQKPIGTTFYLEMQCPGFVKSVGKPAAYALSVSASS
jgi:hypothetical protein